MDESVKSAIPPINCQPWCEDGGGHTEADTLEEQLCLGEEHRVALALHERVKQVGTGAMGEWTESEEYDYLTVYATKGTSADPAVFIGRGEWAGAFLTPSEARRLARDLLLVVSLVEGKVHAAKPKSQTT